MSDPTEILQARIRPRRRSIRVRCECRALLATVWYYDGSTATEWASNDESIGNGKRFVCRCKRSYLMEDKLQATLNLAVRKAAETGVHDLYISDLISL